MARPQPQRAQPLGEPVGCVEAQLGDQEVDPVDERGSGRVGGVLGERGSCVAFGLSMDYEVFLLARIKERFDRTGDLVPSVRQGLGASGPVITMAAAVLAVSFFAMATSVVTPIKIFGLGTGLAILIDAILIRGVLVPAFLELTAPIIWWAPRPLRAVHQRFHVTDSGD